MAVLMPRLFGDMTDWFESEFPFRTGHLIRVEDSLTDCEYRVRAELPGLDPEKDIQVSVESGLLIIHAERREEEQTRSRTEFRYGSLQWAVRLPANADVDCPVIRGDRTGRWRRPHRRTAVPRCTLRHP